MTTGHSRFAGVGRSSIRRNPRDSKFWRAFGWVWLHVDRQTRVAPLSKPRGFGQKMTAEPFTEERRSNPMQWIRALPSPRNSNSKYPVGVPARYATQVSSWRRGAYAVQSASPHDSRLPQRNSVPTRLMKKPVELRTFRQNLENGLVLSVAPFRPQLCQARDFENPCLSGSGGLARHRSVDTLHVVGEFGCRCVSQGLH